MVFRSETPNPGTTLITAKKVTAEWRIRHKFTQTIQPSNPNHSVILEEDTLDNMQEAIRDFIKINFDGSKSSQGAAGGSIIRN